MCRFRGMIGKCCNLWWFYVSDKCRVTQGSHLRQTCMEYSQLVAQVNINLPHTLTSHILNFHAFRRTLVKSMQSKQNKEYRVNNAIKAKNVRLIGQEGQNFGIMNLKEALERGKKETCVVVEVGRSSSETICKLISQQQLYEKMKEDKKKHVKTSKMKEIKVTGKISEHDLEIKLKKIIEFLEDSDSVKVLVAHRRIQNTSVDDKKALIAKIAEQVSDVGYLQGEAKLVGNHGVRAIFVPLQRK